MATKPQYAALYGLDPVSGEWVPLRASAAGVLETGAVVAASDVQLVRTDKDTHFTGALAQNASEDENIAGLNANAGRIRSVIVLSDENLDWEIQFYSKDTFRNADADLDALLERVVFVAADGKQDGGTGLYRYAFTGLDIPYQDLDATSELHISLVNRSAAGKSAGASGEVVVLVGFEA